jgi:hypothetical protein
VKKLYQLVLEGLDLLHMPNVDLAAWASSAWINPPGGGIGPLLTAATTLAPTFPIHHVSSAATITDITLPWTGFQGRIILLADGAFVLNTGGTSGVAISRAITGTSGQPIEVIYDGSIWHPMAGR